MKKKYAIKKFNDLEKSLYHNYVIRYNRARKSLERKGYLMADEKLSKEEFKITYQAARNDLVDLKNRGGKDFTRDITRFIIEKQKFEISASQASEIKKNYKKIMEMEGILESKVPSALEIRAGNTEAFGIIQEYYHDLRAKGLSGKDAKMRISQEIFGS